MAQFTYIDVDSRVKGLGSSWYYGGYDAMTPSELQSLLEKHDAVIHYKGQFYSSVEDANLTLEKGAVTTYGLPTNLSITQNPRVTVVPKGTKWVRIYGSARFKYEFPESYYENVNVPTPSRNWRENI